MGWVSGDYGVCTVCVNIQRFNAAPGVIVIPIDVGSM
jgi:hypothetical protein